MIFFFFLNFWLCWVFVSLRGLSLVVASGGHSSSQCVGLSLSRPLLLRSTGSRRAGSVVVVTGPVAPRHVGSSQTRARTRVPCIGRQILNHCATREALWFFNLGSWEERLHWVHSCMPDKQKISGTKLPSVNICKMNECMSDTTLNPFPLYYSSKFIYQLIL